MTESLCESCRWMRDVNSVFVVSTFDTDYLLVKETDLAKATAALRAAGHTLE